MKTTMQVIITIFLFIALPCFAMTEGEKADLWLDQIAAEAPETKFKPNIIVGNLYTNISPSDWSMSGNKEIAWHVMNVIDAIQTARAVPNCYYEQNYLTQNLIGREPSDEDIVLVSIVYSIIVHYTMQGVDRSNLPKWAKYTANGLLLATKGYTIANNHNIGVRLSGRNKDEIGADGECHRR